MRLTPILLAVTLLASPNQASQARSISPDSTIKTFQPLGRFPTNTVTNRPFVGPQ